ncbi:MAG: helix-turn-helix domain-containing protein [Muribaculaceae bacterium]|nr:helix-turn-helix domain-containing protein [Muribaculaceae bacterium]
MGGCINTLIVTDKCHIQGKEYLTDTSLSVHEIADRMNFNDCSYMCRFFRKNTGMSPMDFRNSKILA